MMVPDMFGVCPDIQVEANRRSPAEADRGDLMAFPFVIHERLRVAIGMIRKQF
jgi:hypothetical protein